MYRKYNVSKLAAGITSTATVTNSKAGLQLWEPQSSAWCKSMPKPFDIANKQSQDMQFACQSECCSYSCVCFYGRSSKAWIGKLPLPLPNSPITHQQAIACKAAARKECSPFLHHAHYLTAYLINSYIQKSSCMVQTGQASSCCNPEHDHHCYCMLTNRTLTMRVLLVTLCDKCV